MSLPAEQPALRRAHLKGLSTPQEHTKDFSSPHKGFLRPTDPSEALLHHRWGEAAARCSPAPLLPALTSASGSAPL